MSDFHTINGFEDAWRAPAGAGRRSPRPVLGAMASLDPRARLTRLINRAPEVVVKVTGRTRDLGGLRAHLNYISRNSALSLEDRDGAMLLSRAEAYEAADGWSMSLEGDSRRRSNTPLSHSLMLSMPEGTDPVKLRDAARAFAAHVFAGEHDYLFTLHTDTPRPHVHMSICSRGESGQRLNPRKADLELWRQTFAQMLRDRGIEAEATPRRARGVTRKSERGPLRRLRERAQETGSARAKVVQSAYLQAARAAFRGETAPTQWEQMFLDRQGRIRGLYLAQATLLKRSENAEDRVLGGKLETFVKSMPAPDSQRLALARELRAANLTLDKPTLETQRSRER